VSVLLHAWAALPRRGKAQIMTALYVRRGEPLNQPGSPEDEINSYPSRKPKPGRPARSSHVIGRVITASSTHLHLQHIVLYNTPIHSQVYQVDFSHEVFQPKFYMYFSLPPHVLYIPLV